MNSDEIIKKLTKARATLIIEQPFFGTLALRLKLIKRDEDWWHSKGIQKPTMAVDGRNIYYSERFVDETPLDELRSAVAHEVGHCIFEHMSRRNGRDPMGWNVAGDFVINEMLQNAGFKLGKTWIQPNPAFKGLSTDAVYNLLPKSDQGGGQGQGQGQGAHDHCFDGDPDGGGENGQSQDPQAEANDWKIATVQAASAAKAQGKLPADLERFIDEMVNPKVDWRARLWHLATERARDDFSWMRPNRRLAGQGIFLPGLYSETMGVMAVAIDTSGSIGQEMLNAFGAEIIAIRDHVRPKELIVIYCDAEVNHVDRFTPEDVPEFKMHGGGGTDFRPPFAWLDEHGIEPVSFVYLTDMMGAFPSAPPPFPTIWCATTKRVGPFGETVHIEV
jgi:predicted metal-dependent peptidase